jgi:hypothetical protein
MRISWYKHSNREHLQRRLLVFLPEPTTSVSRTYEIIWYGRSADENRPIRLGHLMLFPVGLVCVSQLIDRTKLLRRRTYEELKFYSELQTKFCAAFFSSIGFGPRGRMESLFGSSPRLWIRKDFSPYTVLDPAF